MMSHHPNLLKWQHGEEAICPVCRHRNACLQTGNLGRVVFYECRDCHAQFAQDSETNDGVRIERQLGRRCYQCRTYYDINKDLIWNGSPPRQVLHCSGCGREESY